MAVGGKSRFSSERPVDGRAGLGEELCPVLGDMHVVFEPNPELARDDDHGLVGEAHAGLHERFVPAHEVDPLVAFQADAVACPVRQPRHFVIWSESGLDDDLARRRVHVFARNTGPGRLEGCRLRFLLQVPDVELALGGLAEDNGPADVRAIALDVAASVHEDDIPFPQVARLDRTVRKRRRLPEVRSDAARGAERPERGCGDLAELRLGHSDFELRDGGFISFDGDIIRQLHQGQLGRRLDDAAPDGDRIGADVLVGRSFLAHPIIDEETQPFFDADFSGPDSPVLKNPGDDLIRAFVFFPGADVCSKPDELPRPFLLELGRDPGHIALGRQDPGERPLAEAPAHTGEIKHARAAFKKNGIEFVFGHQLPGLLDPGHPLLLCDGDDPPGHGLERSKRALGLRFLRPLLPLIFGTFAGHQKAGRGYGSG